MNAAPPTLLPSKSWFSNTVSNASLREDRRQGLEAYLRAINEADDSRWRNSPAWRAFLNLPSAATASSNGNGSTTSARLHAAITEPGNPASSHAPITDPTLWLDCYRDMKSHLHDARLHLTRRDQETTSQKRSTPLGIRTRTKRACHNHIRTFSFLVHVTEKRHLLVAHTTRRLDKL